MQLPRLKTGNKKEPKQFINQSPFESLLGIAEGVKDTTLDELGRKSVTDAWDQMVGADHKKKSEESHAESGELSAGQEIDLSNVKKETHRVTEQGEDFIREIIHVGKKADAKESQETEVKIQEILIEIKQLTKSSVQLQKQIEIVSMEQTGELVGKYHLNFLENALAWIRDARMNVEDSLAWFHALRSKKASRQYGAMAKKAGTSFTLSQERQAVTQTG